MKKNKKYFILIAVLFFYSLLLFLLYSYFQLDRKNRKNLHYKSQIEKLHAEFQATLNAYNKLGNFVYDTIATDPKTIMYIQKKEKLALYYSLLPYYRLLKKYDIPYLAIVDDSGKSLVVMHKPLKNTYNSSLFLDSKPNLLMIEFKRPIYQHGNIIANFISAINYVTIQKELQKLFHNKYLFILHKNLIDGSAFKFGNFIFVQSEIDPQYYYEKEKNQFVPESYLQFPSFQKDIAKKIKKLLPLHKNFAISVTFQNRTYLLTFLAINKENTHIGYLLSYKEDPTITLFDTIFYQNMIVSAILLLLLFTLLTYFFYAKLQFEQLATVDKLTGVYNRHKFYEIAKKELARSKRGGHPFSLILFDIDHFKKINDTYGHDAGDETLATVAKLVSQNIRESDFLFRWGGEEFIILAPDTKIEQAYNLAEKIRKIIENHQFPIVNKVTISLGVAQFSPSDTSIDQIIKRADMALYRSKEEGRNRTTLLMT